MNDSGVSSRFRVGGLDLPTRVRHTLRGQPGINGEKEIWLSAVPGVESKHVRGRER
jgi:hypothetical protein